ncbi:PREDICTED: putative leucine-rich repeat receptor-like serine/threonine-protein kinase At2g24130, partial [Nelumbo nucifera]
MASISAALLLVCYQISVSFCPILSASVVEDLNNLQPPLDFHSTVANNCLMNPSLRYCNYSSTDLPNIFKSTIVADHLCNESKNLNCDALFTKIDLRNRPKIAPLYLSFTFFWRYCPLTILSIDLSNNSITGAFPSEILYCSQIHSLDLSHNDLSGDVPTQSFSPLTNLTLLNLSYNHFSESKISDSPFFERFNSSSFVHSGLLPDHRKFKIKAVILLIGFPIFVVLMVGFLGWLCFRRQDILPSVLKHRHNFTPTMLNAATAGFSEKNLVGKSRGVEIYKGILKDRTEVRIEIYNEKIANQIRRKFVQECQILVQLSHKNLVRVLGWCDNRGLRAIVTEWTDGGNIESWLSGYPPWKHRLKVLTGLMEGMYYLQEQWPEVDYDLRASSVMLSHDREPLISRFKVGEQNSTSKKIYRLGILLMEMVANRRPQEDSEKSETGFIEWMRMNYPGNVENVIDGRVKKAGGGASEQAGQIIGIALTCTDLLTNRQPSLDQIFNTINRLYASSLAFESPNHKRSHKER